MSLPRRTVQHCLSHLGGAGLSGSFVHRSRSRLTAQLHCDNSNSSTAAPQTVAELVVCVHAAGIPDAPPILHSALQLQHSLYPQGSTHTERSAHVQTAQVHAHRCPSLSPPRSHLLQVLILCHHYKINTQFPRHPATSSNEDMTRVSVDSRARCQGEGGALSDGCWEQESGSQRLQLEQTNNLPSSVRQAFEGFGCTGQKIKG